MVTSDEWNRDASGRFGPGNKGGPGWEKGRPRLSLKVALDRAIRESLREEDGRSILDALAATAIKAAAAGDFRFWKEIIDRLDGPIRQQIEQDQTITIERLARRLTPDEQAQE
tara:strand:- start:146 stop:484 length:339 start_codon:yes stop_codon:yes gene_type:complete